MKGSTEATYDRGRKFGVIIGNTVCRNRGWAWA